MKNAFLSELKERIRDEMGELMVADAEGGGGGQSEWEGGEGSPRHKMLPPSMMNGFSGVNDIGNRY